MLSTSPFTYFCQLSTVIRRYLILYVHKQEKQYCEFVIFVSCHKFENSILIQIKKYSINLYENFTAYLCYGQVYPWKFSSILKHQFLFYHRICMPKLYEPFSQNFDFSIQKMILLSCILTDFADIYMKRQNISIPNFVGKSFLDISIFDMSNIASQNTFYIFSKNILKKLKNLRQSKNRSRQSFLLK